MGRIFEWLFGPTITDEEWREFVRDMRAIDAAFIADCRASDREMRRACRDERRAMRRTHGHA